MYINTLLFVRIVIIRPISLTAIDVVDITFELIC